MALVRKCQGFKRYVFSVSYDGLNSLGFSYQGNNENCITSQGSDFRALHSVEGRIRMALSNLVDGTGKEKGITGVQHSNGLLEESNYENFQVSSRTDRSVHALKNTFHVDLRHKDIGLSWNPQNLIRGLNFHLIRNARKETLSYLKDFTSSVNTDLEMHRSSKSVGIVASIPCTLLRHPENDIRITCCKPAPLELLPNKHYSGFASSSPQHEEEEPSHISWNARFTATSRTYVYRILVHRLPGPLSKPEDGSHVEEYGFPFEAGRSWKIHCRERFDLGALKKAAQILTGTHDFTSFRGKGCYRSTPVTTIQNIQVQAAPVLSTFGIQAQDFGSRNINNNAEIITIAVKGPAFLYRQVRNIVGCLASVGEGKIRPTEVKTILEAKDRRKAPMMAPAHGLYLIDVEHGDFYI